MNSYSTMRRNTTTIFRNLISRQLTEENYISAPKPINHINPYHRRAKTMNKKQEQQILDYYSTTDKYIRSKTHSNAHQTVFTKESDKYQWLHTSWQGRTMYLRPIPFRNLMSATVSRGQSAPSRGNGQGR